LDEIPMGSQVVSVRQVGYNRIELLITFPDRGIVERQFLLSNVRSLDSVVVVAARPAIPEVEERRRLGIGHLIGREDLAKNENGRMSEVLLRLAGLRVVRATGGGQAWIVGTHGGMAEYPPDALSAAMGAKPACYADVWLDGVRVYEGGATGAMLWDVNSIGPKSLEAVEFYAGGNVPIGYSRPNQECGVLLLWTRRGG